VYILSRLVVETSWMTFHSIDIAPSVTLVGYVLALRGVTDTSAMGAYDWCIFVSLVEGVS